MGKNICSRNIEANLSDAQHLEKHYVREAYKKMPNLKDMPSYRQWASSRRGLVRRLTKMENTTPPPRDLFLLGLLYLLMHGGILFIPDAMYWDDWLITNRTGIKGARLELFFHSIPPPTRQPSFQPAIPACVRTLPRCS